MTGGRPGAVVGTLAVVAVAAILAGCSASPEQPPSTASGGPSVEPTHAGPCAVRNESASCVRWRRAGFVAASSTDGFVVAAEPDGIVKGLEAATGTTTWDADVDSEVTAIATIDGRAFVSTHDYVIAFDAASGQEQWRRQASLVDPGDRDTPTILAGDGVVFGVGTGDGQDRWSADAVSGFVGNAVGTGIVVISLETEIVALDRASGDELWRYASDLPIFANVATDEAVVASTASNGSEFDGYVLLDARDGHLINGRDDVSSSMVIESEGHLVEVRFGQGARGIDPETGEYTWTIPLGNALFVGGRAFRLQDRALVLTADQDGVEVIALIDPATGQQRWQVRGDAQLEQVTRGSRFLALARLGGITLHDPEDGRTVLSLAVPHGVVLGDDPLIVYDGDAITGVRTP